MKYATLLVSTLIIIAVLIPGSKVPDVGSGGIDSLAHIGMCALWAVAVRFAFRSRSFPGVLVFVAGLLFSFITDVLQLLVEGRTFDVSDMAADAIGLMLGLLVSGRVLNIVKKRE